MSADLCFTRDNLIFLSLFFRRLISELAKRNLTKIGYMIGSNCDFIIIIMEKTEAGLKGLCIREIKTI